MNGVLFAESDVNFKGILCLIETKLGLMVPFWPNFWARKMARITVRASILKFGLRDGPGLNQFLLVVPRDGTGPKKGPDRGPYGPFTVRALARFNSRSS